MAQAAPNQGRLVASLRDGKVAAIATESTFALMADASNSSALDSLFELKPRGASGGVALMLPSVESWERWAVRVPPLACRLARRFWPGSLTIVLPARGEVDPRLTIGGAIGVRLPGACPAGTVTQICGFATTATSANLPGKPPATTPGQVLGTWSPFQRRKLVVGGRRCLGGLPSPLVAFKGNSLVILRPGAVPVIELEQHAHVCTP